MNTVSEIAKNLLARREVASLLGAPVRPTGAGLLGMFGFGVLLGAGIGMLLAPKPGRELRQELTSRLGEASQRMQHNGGGMHAQP